jgi:lipoate-protein ligase A
MQLLQLTLPTAVENLALDEALLDAAEARELDDDEVLRIWEPTSPVAVLGRSSRVADEINLQEARRLDVPVLRRASGGASIVTAPGCLMYAVVLNQVRRPQLRAIDAAHRYVLDHLAMAIRRQGFAVYPAGTSDLAYSDRKVSGNSMRCKRTHLLYHGTLLYAMDLSWIARLLLQAPRQPEYRRARPHDQFVANVPVEPGILCRDLCQLWQVSGTMGAWPQERTRRLVEECYGRTEWVFRF